MSASVASLVISSLVAIAGGALIAIAFGTNNWIEYSVDYTKTIPNCESPPAVLRDVYCYSRMYGYFRKCFPKNEINPSAFIEIYEDPTGYNCTSSQIDYSRNIDSAVNSKEKKFIHLQRTQLAFYIVSLSLGFIGLLFLLAGCGKRSSRLVIIAGVLFFFSAFFVAASMGIFIYNGNCAQEFASDNNFSNANYYAFYSEPLGVKMKYGWSFIIGWIGCGLLLFASILMFVAAAQVNAEKKREDAAEATRAYYTGTPQAYDGKMALVAANGNGSSSGAYANYGYNTYSPYAGYGTYNPYSAYYAPYYMHYYTMQK